MNWREVVIIASGIGICRPALGGGLFVPGQGPISTARGGAAVASAEDGEAIGINPAGMAAVKGTMIQLGIVALDYTLSFTRAGAYDSVTGETVSYAHLPYPTVRNDSRPFGMGSYVPIPTIAVVSDLGGKIPGLHAGIGLYAPQGYPFRDMNTVNGKSYFDVTKDGRYGFPAFGQPPPPTRYDVIHQDAAAGLMSVALAYRIHPTFDLGARFTAGSASLKASAAAWAEPNYEEWIQRDVLVTADAKDNFVFTYGVGAVFRPAKSIDIGVNFNAPIHIHAQGDVSLVAGPQVKFAGMDIIVSPVDDSEAKCAKGGTANALKGCADLQLPMSVQLGGRYKFMNRTGRLAADIELDLTWEHWGAKCDYARDPTCVSPSDYRLFVDAQASLANIPELRVPFREVIFPHGLRDTYGARLGGSYVVPAGDDAFVVRGGVGYETAAAKPGWERVDLDGAARTTLAVGASYRWASWSIDAGFGMVLEGTRSANRNCNPSVDRMGCDGSGIDTPIGQRQGPDPVSPVVAVENPINQGTMRSHYTMWMAGISRRF